MRSVEDANTDASGVSCIEGMALVFLEPLLLLVDHLLVPESDPGGDVNVVVDATTTEFLVGAWTELLVFLLRRNSNGVSKVDDDDFG